MRLSLSSVVKDMHILMRSSLLVAGVVVALSCQRSSLAVEQQVADGERLYQQVCSSCHQSEGSLGPPLTRDILKLYRSAQTLYDYVSLAMPYDSVGSLPESDYWMVLAYLLDSNELLRPRIPLSAKTAERVRFDR